MNDFVHSQLDSFKALTTSNQKDVFVDCKWDRGPGIAYSLVKEYRFKVKFDFPTVHEQLRSYEKFIDVNDDVKEAKQGELKHQRRTEMAKHKRRTARDDVL
ncbi:hypothetical protein BGX31_008952 [Mortierella sp. GBA43]|nr:hypothetical protein BGX31_008952 [Mortierella sp. GBA43]